MNPEPAVRGVRSRDVWVVLANVLALAVGVALLWHLRTIVSWILVSILFALALRPAVLLLCRRARMRRGLAVAIVAGSVLALIAVAAATIVPLVVDQGRQLVESGPDLLRRLEDWGPMRWLVARLGADYEPRAIIDQHAGGLADHAFSAARSMLEGVVALITIASLTVFMLITGDELAQKSLAWFPPERRAHLQSLGRRVTRVVGGYVAGTLVVAAIGGVVMGTTLAVLGVPYFLPLALAMAMLGIVPFVGSAIGAVLLVGLTFASRGWEEALICAVVYLVYQQIENEVLHPIVQRRTIHMNVLLVALALLVGTALAGLVGALLALPIAGAIQIVVGDALDQRRARWGEDDAPSEEEKAQSRGDDPRCGPAPRHYLRTRS